MIDRAIPSSFRDPSGFLFFKDKEILRQVNLVYREDYDLLMRSGLYEALTGAGLLVKHQETDINFAQPDRAYKIIKPEQIPFISYPYEWCFSQLKEAALTTLNIQKTALKHGMSLKDSSAYNIQFSKAKPVLIDTLSFEKYEEGSPWVAYRQFCQHFLAPLALMSYTDIRLNQLLRIYIDGIPLDLASSLLPLRSRMQFSLYSHIHLHAKSQRLFKRRPVSEGKVRVGHLNLLAIVDNLQDCVKNLKIKQLNDDWVNYYEDNNYSPQAFERKKQLVSDFLNKLGPKVVWDFGANTGLFSRIAADKGILTISFDSDPFAVEKNYSQHVSKGVTDILPLCLDLTNPSPAIGWQNRERSSIFERGPADTVLFLALIHHLAISNNVPLNRIAELLRDSCSSLIIEFVPKDDAQLKRLLLTRKDIFTDYNQQAFEAAFSEFFTTEDSEEIGDSKRRLYLMRRNSV